MPVCRDSLAQVSIRQLCRCLRHFGNSADVLGPNCPGSEVSVHLHRHSQDFVWGCTVFPQKSWRPFLLSPSKQAKNYDINHSHLRNLPRRTKKFPKIWLLLCLGGGALQARVHLQLIPVNYAAHFFTSPWQCKCTQCTPGYDYVQHWKQCPKIFQGEAHHLSNTAPEIRGHTRTSKDKSSLISETYYQLTWVWYWKLLLKWYAVFAVFNKDTDIEAQRSRRSSSRLIDWLIDWLISS